MKTHYMLPVLFLFLFTSTVFPQQNQKTSYGIFSGVSLNTNSYEFEDKNNLIDTSYSNSTKAAFNLGVFVIYDFTDNFGVKLQGQYANKGGITKVNTFYSSDLTMIERTYTNTINYLQFALLPQLNLSFNKNSPDSKSYFNAGGYLSIKLSATESIENQTLYQNLNTEKDISNSLTGTDAGLIFGAGIIYKGFLLDIRYDLGLSNIVGLDNVSDVLSIKNRSINISVGWTGGF